MSHSILVVEDDEELRPMLVEVLRDEGYEVQEAGNGTRALQHVESTFFDLIITDVRMEGMDGLETAEAIHRVQPDVPVIVITGFAQQDAPLRAIRQGAFDYLHKPFQLRELLLCVSRALNNQELLDQLESEAAVLEDSFGGNHKNARTRVFRKFYVGIRSGGLDKMEALKVWELLENAEDQTSGGHLKAEETLDAARFSLLIANDTSEIPNDFHYFFDQIKSGDVSAQEVFIAPRLRKFPHERLKDGFPELASVRSKLWGPHS
jgi:CheY-like chemotaxis protein